MYTSIVIITQASVCAATPISSVIEISGVRQGKLVIVSTIPFTFYKNSRVLFNKEKNNRREKKNVTDLVFIYESKTHLILYKYLSSRLNCCPQESYSIFSPICGTLKQREMEIVFFFLQIISLSWFIKIEEKGSCESKQKNNIRGRKCSTYLKLCCNDKKSTLL